MDFINLNKRKWVMSNDVIFVNKTEENGEDKMFKMIEFGSVMVLLIAGLIVNLFLIIAVRRSPRLKAPIFQLIFALAFADTILLVAYSLPEIGDYFASRWVFGTNGCRALLFLRFLPAHVSTCLIVICCWERFSAVCRPHSAIGITSRKMSGIIAVIWLINTGFLAPLIVMTREVEIRYSTVEPAHSCMLTMTNDVKKLYFTVMGMIFYGITAFVSVAFLSCTVCKIAKVDLENYFIKDDFKNHILRCIAVITGVSIVSWIPHYYTYFYNLHSTDGSHADVAIAVFGTICILVSGVLKPILYISISSQFRKAIVRSIKCCESNHIDYHQTHGYKMNDRLMLTETEPL